MTDIKFLVRLIIELERCSFFSFVALDELKMMKKCPDTHHKSRVGRVTVTTPFFLFGLKLCINRLFFTFFFILKVK